MSKKNDDIKVIVVNKPTKEEADKKIKELCEFLSKTWHTKIEPK